MLSNVFFFRFLRFALSCSVFIAGADAQSLPLAGKVLSASEADEVLCKAELDTCYAAVRLHLISQLLLQQKPLRHFKTLRRGDLRSPAGQITRPPVSPEAVRIFAFHWDHCCRWSIARCQCLLVGSLH